MKKNIIKTAKYSKVKHIFTWFLRSVFYLSILILLFINIFYSQIFPNILGGLVRGESSYTIDFMKKVKNNQNYLEILYPEQTHLFSRHIKDINLEDKLRDIKIQKYESLLQINSKARDVLYSLFLLYSEKGEHSKAMEYYNMAKSVDPMVGSQVGALP